MAEKQKESSSNAKSKEKTALLDLDIGKDFLTSWKSMSEDDQMDFDFPTVTKGNKKPFKFDNMCSNWFHDISHGGSLNSNDTRTILTSRSRLQEMDVAKGEPVPNRSVIEDLNKSRKFDRKISETGRKSAVLSNALSREQIEGGSVQIRSRGIPKDLTINGSNRGG